MKSFPEIELKRTKKEHQEDVSQAIQIADRFHLLENLNNPLEIVFDEYPLALKNVETIINAKIMSEEDKIIAQPVPSLSPAKATVERGESNRSKRAEQYEQVHTLNQQGWTKIAIANKLGISRRKVFRFLKSATFPERKGRSDRVIEFAFSLQ